MPADRHALLRHCTDLLHLHKPTTFAGKDLAASASDPTWRFCPEWSSLISDRPGPYRRQHATKLRPITPSARPSPAARSSTLQSRYGSFIGQQKLKQWNLAPESDGSCRLCKTAPDTGYHTLTTCPNQTLAGLRTLRHDAAVHLIRKAIHRGTLGGWCLLTSAGRVYASNNSGVPTMENTVPFFLLPGGYPGLNDLLLIENWDGAPGTTPDKAIVILSPLELAYCADCKCKEAIFRKHRKYKGTALPTDSSPNSLLGRDLLAEYRSAGWRTRGQHEDMSITTEGANIITIALGVTGLITESSRTVFETLGLSPAETRTLLAHLSRNAANYAGSLLATKRYLERSLFPPQTPYTRRRSNLAPARSSLPRPYQAHQPHPPHTASSLHYRRTWDPGTTPAPAG